MSDFSVSNYATPLLIVCTGLVTLAAMLMGYLYLHKRAQQDAAKQRNLQKNLKHEQLSGSRSDEEETKDDIPCQWPLDKACMFSTKNSGLSGKEIDALEFCGHIPSEIKKAKVKATQKKIEQEMTAEQKEEERRLQREQLKAIFDMMADQKEKFGVGSVDDINEQMRLYM